MALPSDLYTMTVTGSFKDAGGATLPGSVTFTLSALLADGTGNVVIPAYPKPYQLSGGALLAGPLVSNDSPDLLPTNSTYLVTVALQNMQQYSYSVQLLAAPFTFTATNATPCVFTAAGSAYANGTAVTLTGGSLPAGFTDSGTVYYVVSASGTSFSLAATSGGSAIASTGTGSGTVSTASVDLADLQPVVSQGTPVSYVPTSGGTYTGTVVFDGSPAIQIPSGAAAGQVFTSDGSGNGVWAAPALVVKPEVQEATAAALPANAYASGVLTASSNGALTVDGIAVTAGDRVLVKNEVTAANNGVYVVTATGASGAKYVLTRSADMNTAADIPGAFVFAESGNANFQTGWMVTGSGPWTLGSTVISWVKFSAAPAASLIPTAVKTSAYTAAGGDFVLCDTQTTGAFTVTLPTAPADKTTIGVKMVKQTAPNAVTVARGGSDTFNDDGSTSATLALINQSAVFQYDATLTAWVKVSGDTPLAQLDARYAKGVFNVLNYGATGNGITALDGAITTGTATLTSASLVPFTGTRNAWVTGAGAAGAVLQATITCTAGGTATLGTNASGTVSGAVIYWGTDDTTAFQNAIAAALPTAGVVLVPPAGYLISSPLVVLGTNTGSSNVPQAAPSILGIAGAGHIGDYSTYGQSATTLIALPTFPLGSFLIDYQQAGTGYGPAGAKFGGFTLDCHSRAAGFRAQGCREFHGNDMTITMPAAPVSPGDTASGGFSVTYITGGTTAGAYNTFEHITVTGALNDAFFDDTNDVNLYLGCVAETPVNACFHIGNDGENWYTDCIYCGGLYGFQFDAGGTAVVKGAVPLPPYPSLNTILMYGGKNGPTYRWATKFTDCIFINEPVISVSEHNGAILYAETHLTYIQDALFTGCYFGTGVNGYTSDWAYSDSGSGAGQGILFNGCMFNGTPTTHQYNDNGNLFTFRNCPGINPLGSLTVAVPSTGVATASAPVDRVFYVSAATGGCSVAVSSGPTIAVPAAGVGTIYVPAGQTVTPTYTNAPTWSVSGL